MRFTFTMHMPSRGREQSLVHQVVGEHPARGLDELLSLLSSADFIIVEEYYKDRDHGTSRNVGPIALNSNMIGKVKVAP